MRTILFLLLVPSAAAASPRFELGVALGGHAFSDDSELGVADDMTEPGPEDAALIGARFGVPINKRLAAEAEAVAIPTQDDVLGDDARVFGLRAHARFDLLTGRLRPFVVAGLGAHLVRSSSPQMDNDADRAYHWGAGVRFALNDNLGVRLDLRHLLVPDRTRDGATSDVEVTVGLAYQFGKRAQKPAVPPPLPPAPGDRDGDSIVDNLDECPANAEDADAFEDRDGCPDPDNDVDGIADASDGCPIDAESKNGWKDADGCPDQVIQELAGIGFEVSSAIIDEASKPILERAYEILHDNEDIAVEISGHTSSEGDPDRNQELSLRRAEAVKAYLVKRGIAGSRILTLGHGAEVPVADNDTEEGRRKNRRIEFRILVPGERP